MELMDLHTCGVARITCLEHVHPDEPDIGTLAQPEVFKVC